ncbi:MAG: hypothetical protein KF803_12170 [Cyclobacteriaceae bacterium]|nr:hypothetical protein [Cyclobacteriaceae bacterium]
MKVLYAPVLALVIACTTNSTKQAETEISLADTVVIEQQDQDPTSSSAEIEDDADCVCDVSAYLDDPDDSGTNIRATPGGKIIGQLKYEEDCGCLTVRFVESKNGWMKLSEGGWVYGKLFSVDTRNYASGEKVYLNEYPTDESEVVAEFDREKHFSVKGCCGTWLLVEDEMGKSGWLTADMICANPLTNCS